MSAIDSEAKIDATAVSRLRRGLRGEVIQPTDAGYDEARRVWNGSIERAPTLIARCTGAEDVAAAVRFGREAGLPIAVRSGGHSFPGHSVCDGGLVIELRPMNQVRIDPEARTASIGAGVLIGELDHQTQPFGLAVPGGIVTHTGMAGLTLGGGIGWLQRRHGLSIDQLLSAMVVTAGGEQVKASDDENPDLFWGLRGGGGNFGIVTEFEFRLCEAGPTVLAGPILWAMEDSPQMLRFYRDWIAEAPEELMTIVIHRKAPALASIPAELHGRLVVAVACCWTGPIEEGEKVLRPLRDFGSPLLDACAPKPFTEHQASFDPSYPHGWWYYMRSCDVAGLSDEVIDITTERAMQIRSPRTSFPIWQMGGAITRASADETAFGGRHDGFTFNLTAMTETEEGFEAEREWVRGFWSALEPHHSGVYVNFLMEEGEERVREAYGAERYDRLKALKRRWDPDNTFRLNQNIAPT